MPLPRKAEILRRAREKAMEKGIREGLPAITPTEEELKESGDFLEAQRDLMTTHAHFDSQQMQYIHEVAGEVGLKVVGKGEHRQLSRKAEAFDKFHLTYPTFVKKLNGYEIRIPDFSKKPKTTRPKPKLPKPQIPKKALNFLVGSIKPISMITASPKKKPKKKRQRNHSARTGKTMKALRHVKGVRVFSFPDDVWKVRKKRKRK